MKQLKNPKHAFYQNGSMQKSLIDRDTHTHLPVCECSHTAWYHRSRGGGGGEFWVCDFVYSAVTFLTSYFHTTSFITPFCEVERKAAGVERSGAPAA